MRAMTRRRTVALLLVSLTVLVTVWNVATPPSAGPDEPSHITRAAALVRWRLDGERVDERSTVRAFQLPAEIAFPDPGCFVLLPGVPAGSVPATCATSEPVPDGDAIRLTTSNDYPIWGHLLPGLGTFVPGRANGFVARWFDALVPVLLVAGAVVVAARRGWTAVAGTAVALTPMAWFTFAVVNPSGLVIAGGIGLWVAIGSLGRAGPSRNDPLVDLLLAGSWAAMVLPRRDGLVWAALVLAAAVLIFDLDLVGVVRRTRWPVLAVIATATLATLAWAWRSETGSSSALFAAPLAPVAAELIRRTAHDARMASTRRRVIGVVTLGVLAVGGMVAVASTSGIGLDGTALRGAIGETGINLTEAIGVLGWVDAPVPTTAVHLLVAALGALGAMSLVTAEWRLAVGALGVLVIAVAMSWTLTIVQNDPPGTYWQGRYYLPFLVGIPIVLGSVRIDNDLARRVGTSVVIAGLAVTNVALAAAMRRFGVGVSGSFVPTDWDTYDAPLPPVALLVVHVVASGALFVALARLVSAPGDVPVSDRPIGTDVRGADVASDDRPD